MAGSCWRISSDSSGTGDRQGDSAMGSTVALGDTVVSVGWCVVWGLKSSCDRGGRPLAFRICASSSMSRAFICSACWMAASRSLFLFSSCSTSCLLRSREDWAARRFRRTRSTRRCSFSSAVLARFLGGRFVLGSGRTWPHDFLFLVVFFSGAGEGLGVDATPSSCLIIGSRESSL